MEANTPVRSLEDCIKNRNLFLIHIGHSWFIIRATDRDSVMGGAIPLPLLNQVLPRAAMIDVIAKITDVPKLEQYMKAGQMTKDEVIATLNTPLPEGGYQSLTGASSAFFHQWPPALK